MTSPEHPVPIALVGATATGKTALALDVARRLGDVELLSVDAMAVYRGLDVGTAKPDPAEREAASWHLLDLAEPSEEFSVARFQRAARSALAGIARRGHRPVLVGGTGLYHRAVLDDLALPGRYRATAAQLEAEVADVGPEALHARLAGLDPLAASRIEPTNVRRVLRALEVTLGSGRRFSESGPGLSHYPASAFAIFGLALDRAELDRRIAARIEAQLAAGWLEEVARLRGRAEPLSRTAAQALGYRELLAHLAGELTLDQARAEILRRTKAFARRQESWFRRDPRVRWVAADDPNLLDRVIEQLADHRPASTWTAEADGPGGRMER